MRNGVLGGGGIPYKNDGGTTGCSDSKGPKWELCGTFQVKGKLLGLKKS